jgi:hypothetical protein
MQGLDPECLIRSACAGSGEALRKRLIDQPSDQLTEHMIKCLH